MDQNIVNLHPIHQVEYNFQSVCIHLYAKETRYMLMHGYTQSNPINKPVKFGVNLNFMMSSTYVF